MALGPDLLERVAIGDLPGHGDPVRTRFGDATGGILESQRVGELVAQADRGGVVTSGRTSSRISTYRGPASAP